MKKLFLLLLVISTLYSCRDYTEYELRPKDSKSYSTPSTETIFVSLFYKGTYRCSPVRYQIPLDNMNQKQDSIYQILLTKPVGYSIKIKEYNH